MVGDFYNATGTLDPTGAYARISSILGIASEPAIEAYRLRLAAEGGLDAVAEDKLFYTERGTAIHDAAEQFMRSGEVVLLPSEYEPYINGFTAWVAKVQPTNCLMEMPLKSDKHMFAGRCDLICYIDGETWIVDYKTSKSFRDTMGLQLAAYRQAYYEDSGIWARTGILQLTPEIKRGYRWKEYDETLTPFLGLLEYFRWRQSKQKKVTPLESTWDGQSLQVAQDALDEALAPAGVE